MSQGDPKTTANAIRTRIDKAKRIFLNALFPRIVFCAMEEKVSMTFSMTHLLGSIGKRIINTIILKIVLMIYDSLNDPCQVKNTGHALSY